MFRQQNKVLKNKAQMFESSGRLNHYAVDTLHTLQTHVSCLSNGLSLILGNFIL